jgi:hypothetical protein
MVVCSQGTLSIDCDHSRGAFSISHNHCITTESCLLTITLFAYSNSMSDLSSQPSAAQTRTESFRAARPSIVGPDVPEPPFPIALSGPVQRGFGRGGKDLGCPTGGSHTHLYTQQYLAIDGSDISSQST